MPVDTVRCAPRNNAAVLPVVRSPACVPYGAFFHARGTGSDEDRLSAAVGQSAAWCNRGGPISAEPRINDRIRVPEVRLVGPSGEQVGIVPLAKALELAQEYDLDLVEVAANARPPVCKLMDYGKFKYESAMKAREARKNQAHTVIKEMKLRPKIDPHDYDTKKGHVVRFLKQGDKVKITIMFRGREQSRPELGFRLLQRLAEDVQDLGFIESNPKQDGRNMIMVLGPHKKKTEAMAEARQAQEARKAEAKANPGKSQNAADADIDDIDEIGEADEVTVEAPAEASAEA
jgi:translation initiation factor IF-3